MERKLLTNLYYKVLNFKTLITLKNTLYFNL